MTFPDLKTSLVLNTESPPLVLIHSETQNPGQDTPCLMLSNYLNKVVISQVSSITLQYSSVAWAFLLNSVIVSRHSQCDIRMKELQYLILD